MTMAKYQRISNHHSTTFHYSFTKFKVQRHDNELKCSETTDKNRKIIYVQPITFVRPKR